MKTTQTPQTPRKTLWRLVPRDDDDEDHEDPAFEDRGIRPDDEDRILGGVLAEFDEMGW